MKNVSILGFAYVGDAVYELLVREHLLSCSVCSLKKLKEKFFCFITANRQLFFLKNDVCFD